MKIFCIGRNYVEHAKELNNPIPKKPLVFMKPNTSLLVKGRHFFYPSFSNEIHYECEVVLKIGKNGRHVEPQFADRYISEISLGLDLTARDIQRECKAKGHPWEIAKGFDFSAPIGEFIPYGEWKGKDIPFQLKKNGTVVQDGNTKEMIFNFNHLISYISTIFTLKLGDLIYTGTPAGVGEIHKGDLFEGYINNQHLLSCNIR